MAYDQSIPEESLAVGLLHHVAAVTGQIPHTAEQHDSLVSKITLMSAWTQVLAVVGAFGVFGVCYWGWWRRRR